MRGIREMFAEFSGESHYDEVCDNIVSAKKLAVEYTRQWRIDNSAKFRENRKKYRKAYAKRYPERERARKKAQRARNIENTRAAWRRAAKKQREKRKSKCNNANTGPRDVPEGATSTLAT